MPTLFVILVEVVLVIVVLGRITGKNVFDTKLSSGLIRLLVGLLSALACYAIWNHCFRQYGRICVAELPAGTSIASFLLAVTLIPLGTIQTFCLLLKRLYLKIMVHRKTKRA